MLILFAAIKTHTAVCNLDINPRLNLVFTVGSAAAVLTLLQIKPASGEHREMHLASSKDLFNGFMALSNVAYENVRFCSFLEGILGVCVSLQKC